MVQGAGLKESELARLRWDGSSEALPASLKPRPFNMLMPWLSADSSEPMSAHAENLLLQTEVHQCFWMLLRSIRNSAAQEAGDSHSIYQQPEC